MVQRAYEDRIRELAEPVVEAEGMELILVECLRMKSRWIVRLYMDKEGGVTLDDCAEISNQLGDILDVNDIPPGQYILEVSSPGLDRPLHRAKDFLKYKGSNVCIRIDEKLDGIRNFRGKLVDFVDEDGKSTVILEVLGAIRRIPRDRIVRAHLKNEI
ncbi:MAG TPA: ribosome maturation factor RimP [Syntrophales bacterium]|nr:ribosome maturation factor RimP [Syntrophales bacterium]